LADCRAVIKFKQQKNPCFEAKAGPWKKSLAFFLEEINTLKRLLTPASSKWWKAQSLFSTEITEVT
jgi:hypothetical protein